MTAIRGVGGGAPLTAITAAAVGLGVSIYLTVEHFTAAATLACPDSGAVNCAKVTSSRWAAIAGVPVAVLGVAFFVGLLALLLAPSHHRPVHHARLATASLGVLTVFWLVYVELFLVDAICLWCTVVHLLTLVVFGAVLWDWLALPAAVPARVVDD